MFWCCLFMISYILTGLSAWSSMGSVRNQFSNSFNFCQFKFKISDLIDKSKYAISIFRNLKMHSWIKSYDSSKWKKIAVPGHSQTLFFFDGWYNNRVCKIFTNLFSYKKILVIDTFGLFRHKIIKLSNIFNKKFDWWAILRIFDFKAKIYFFLFGIFVHNLLIGVQFWQY